MKPNRRWFQYSLRSFLILLTASAVWLGVVVRSATEQQEAVKAIEALGGKVYYDWQDGPIDIFSPADRTPPGPAWLRRVIGDEYFQEVTSVTFRPLPPLSTSTVQAWLPELKRFRKLKALLIGTTISTSVRSILKEALPNCEIRALRGWNQVLL